MIKKEHPSFVANTVRDRASLVTAGVVGVAVEGILVWRIGAHAVLPAALYFGAIGDLLAVIDLRSRRIPNLIVLPSIVIEIGLLTMASAINNSWYPLERAAIGSAATAIFYFLVGLTGGIGAGDVKLAAFVGLIVAWFDYSTLVLGVCAGLITAMVASLILFGLRKVTSESRLPFAPFLVTGAVFAITLR